MVPLLLLESLQRIVKDLTCRAEMLLINRYFSNNLFVFINLGNRSYMFYMFRRGVGLFLLQ